MQNSGQAFDNTNNTSAKKNEYRSWIVATEGKCSEDLCIVSRSSTPNLIIDVSECALGCKENVSIREFEMFRHVKKMTLQCKNNHTLKTDICHKPTCSVFFSGWSYAQYKRLSKI